MGFLSISSTIVVLVAVLVVGAVLVVVGLWGRRTGDAPHCRKCGYNLTGAAGDKCPECGAVLGANVIVTGVRRRRGPALVVGLLLVLVGGGGLGAVGYGYAQKVDWYTYYPASSLVRMAKADDPRAINELINRLKNDTLRQADCGELVAAALDRQGAVPAPANITKWADILGYIDGNGWLSAEQQDRFYRQLGPMKFSVRPRIKLGEFAVMEIKTEDQGTFLLAGRFKMRTEGWRLDGKTMPFGGGETWDDVPLGWGGIRARSTYSFGGSLWDVGIHKVACVVAQAVFAASADPEVADPLWSRKVTLDGEVEVVPDSAPDPITLVENDELLDVLRDAIKVDRIERQRWEEGGPEELSVTLTLNQPAPMCLAFDVFVVTADREIALDTVCWPKGEQGTNYVSPGFWFRTQRPSDYEIPDAVMVELRASRDAASKSADCFEVWGGKLRLGPIEVTAEKSVGAPPPSAKEATGGATRATNGGGR
jgi:hypothetical protein